MSKAIISISGTVGKDPDIRATSNGYMAAFSVATNARQKERDGNWADVTSWFEVVTFAKSEDWLRNNFFKGAKVFVNGELIASQWADREGNKRTSLRVTANVAEGLSKPEGHPQQSPIQPNRQVAPANDFGGGYDVDIPFMRVMGPW